MRSRRCTKRLGGGIFLALILLASSSSRSALGIEHLTWLIDQLVAPPLTTTREERRTQIGAGLVTYSDTLSLQASGVLDLKELELRPLWSERFFPAIFEQGSENKNLLTRIERTLGVELARYYATANESTGRFAAGYYRFSPMSFSYLRFGVDTSIQLQTPWSAAIAGSYFFSFPRGEDMLFLRFGALNESQLGKGVLLKLGGFLSFTNRLRNLENIPPGVYETMLVTFGPEADLKTAIGTFKLVVNVRLFLDKKIDPTGNATPSEFGLPDVSLGWGQLL